MTRKNAERQEAIERLREEINPGDKIYTILRHRSRSGMQRSISIIQIDAQGTPREWDYLAARAMGLRIDNTNGGIKVNGCGMDMGFDLVYSLSWTLFPSGFGCVGEKCRSSDHPNGDRDYTPHKDKASASWKSKGGRVFVRTGDRRPPTVGEFYLQTGMAVQADTEGIGSKIILREAEHRDLKHWHKDGGYALVHAWL